jgi:RimJ/RimL family protein N-acetyltransferase
MIDAANYSATETLRDGRTVEIRAQRPEDLHGWRAALARTSAATVYRRFFGAKREISEKEAHYFLDIDFVKHVALVAIANEDGRPTLIGGGRYVVVEPGKAEVAFALIDEYQAKGIGSALIRHLAAIGREAGLRELVAEVLSDNLPMLKVFERSGLAMNTRREGTVVHVTLRYP